MRNSYPEIMIPPVGMFYFLTLGVFLIVAGFILRSAAVKAGKDWLFGTALFCSGCVMGYLLAGGLSGFALFNERMFIGWLLNLSVSLAIVEMVSFIVYHLFDWFDSSRYDRHAKMKPHRRESI
jgi:hypothetical protein